MDASESLTALINRRIDFRHAGHSLAFDLSTALFSSASVDAGTASLLGTIERREIELPVDSVLDIGCGTGTLGISLAKAHNVRLIATDRDALAAWFTGRNAAINGISNAITSPALITYNPFEPLQPQRAGIAVCNLPAKAGEPVLRSMITSLPALVAPGGIAAVVIVRPLAELLETTLRDGQFTVISLNRSAGHVVAIYGPGAGAAVSNDAAAAPDVDAAFVATDGQAAADGGDGASPVATDDPITADGRGEGALLPAVYRRGHARFDGPHGRYSLTTAWNLGEFDSLGYGTTLAFRLFHRSPPGGRVFAWGTGQGHLLCGGIRRSHHGELIVGGRDLLSVATTVANLRGSHTRSKVSALVVPGLASAAERVEGMVDWMIVQSVPEPDSLWSQEIQYAAKKLLPPGGRLVVVSRSTSLSRLAAVIGSDFSRRESAKHHGYRVDLLVRKH